MSAKSTSDMPPEQAAVSTAIEVQVETLEQLFHTLDPYPFRARDLDRDAEEFIVDWARELPRDQPITILIHIPKDQQKSEQSGQVENALRRYFRYRQERTSHDISELFAVGRLSLIIGLVTLTACVLAARFMATLADPKGFGQILSEGFIILGWVANWRPAEIFLYDWWPIVRRRNLYRRLSLATVEFVFR